MHPGKMHSGSLSTPDNPAYSLSIGVVALIIEGRPLYDTEYGTSGNDDCALHCYNPRNLCSPLASPDDGIVDSPGLHNPQYRKQQLSLNITNTPTTNPNAFAANNDSVQHLERLRQKLNQIRSLPGTSRDSSEQSVAISINSPPSSAACDQEDPDIDADFELGYKHYLSSIPSANWRDKAFNQVAFQYLATPTTSSQRTPRSLSEHNGLLQTITTWTSNMPPAKFSTPSTSSSSDLQSLTSPSWPEDISPIGSTLSFGKREKRSIKVLGPHCKQFLAKIGVMKTPTQMDHSIEMDEHECVRSNESCYRWQQCYKQIVMILSKNEHISIEVYLGPEHRCILLEQWVIEQNHTAGRFPMNIQALCTAIRSQLHFSQITAWSDLLRSVSPFDTEITTNPRVKNATAHGFAPKLDILYRVRPHSDATAACFTGTPIVHNFPETQISEQHSVKITLRSLPRMKAIPRLDDGIEVSDALKNYSSTMLQPLIVDDLHGFASCTEKGKHRCPFDEESPTDDTTMHRDKQLMKYKKRMLRRDRKKRGDETVAQCGGDTFSRSVDTKSVDSMGKVIQLVSSQYDQTINPNKPPLYSTMSVDETEPVVSAMSTANVMLATTPKISSASMTMTTACLNAASQATSTQTMAVEMTSVATQTDANQIIFHNCDYCGIEMQYFCWNCDKKMFTETEESQQHLEKADRLLKSIQRTPSTKQQTFNKKNRSRKMADGEDNQQQSNDAFGMVLSGSPNNMSQHNSSSSSSGIATNSDTDQCDTNSTLNENQLDISDCRSCCKRLKTVHNYFRDTIHMPIENSNINNANSNGNKNNTNSNNNSKTNDNNEHSNSTRNNRSQCEDITANSPCGNPSSSSSKNNDLAMSSQSINSPRTKAIGNVFPVIHTNRITSYDDTQTHLMVKRDFNDSGTAGYRRTMSESVVGKCHTATANCTQPGIDLIASDAINILSDSDLKLYRRAYSEDELICNCDDNRPKHLDISDDTSSPPIYTAYAHDAKGAVPTPHSPIECGASHYGDTNGTVLSKEFTLAVSNTDFKTPKQAYDPHTKPIYIDCHSHTDDERSQEAVVLTATKSLPKINLSKLLADPANERDTATLPYTLKNVFDFENLSPPLLSPGSLAINATVQKSQSTPSFQYSPTLSPRFLKSSAANKRRTRHLSDRSSERLSTGSDELLSDDEFHQYCLDADATYRPGISPTKATLRFFPKNYAYRKRALLGSFEESLLQRRFEPKFLVPGYKVLLGASGCYCTNQITIPAYTFFYEMNAETLSTPYVCEVGMPPRKGYVIPRTGHVQATLLNPNGMVVRMFVVAYDFRDMPAMCQTFVRQRILSFDENANPGQNVDDLSPSEQMKLLRYAIHLRFQTTRSGRLALHGDIRMLVSRRTDTDTAAAHAKGALESPSELKTVTIVPENPKFSPR